LLLNIELKCMNTPESVGETGKVNPIVLGVGKDDIISKVLNDSKTVLAEHIEYIKMEEL